VKQLQIEQPIKQSASLERFALVLSAAIGSVGFPDFERFLQFHAARTFEQHDISGARLSRQPLARFLGRGDKFRPNASPARGFDHGLGQAAHSEQCINFPRGGMLPCLAM
jgi:hypothetical protein